MSVGSRIHGFVKAEFEIGESVGVRWIRLEDVSDNSVTIFVNHIDQLRILQDAIDRAFDSFTTKV